VVSDSEKARYQQQYENWIREMGIQLSQQSNPNVYSEMVYTHPNGMAVGILQLKDQSDRIVISTRLNMPPEVQQSFSGLPQDEQLGLLNEVKYGLLQLGVQFAFPMQDNVLQAVVVERTVFGESLTKQILFDNLYRVIDGLVFIQTKIHEKLGARVGRSSNTNAYG
jgi:hypothetical protein